jgi:hypothetical protein
MNMASKTHRVVRQLALATRAWRDCRLGSLAIEFAIIAPAALTLLLGVAESSRIVSQKLTLQSAARAGLNYGLIKPPVQGDLSQVTAALRSNLPSTWNATDAHAVSVAASLQCECEVSGAITCGNPCGAGERTLTFLTVTVTKPYVPMLRVSWMPAFNLSNTSTMRLQ